MTPNAPWNTIPWNERIFLKLDTILKRSSHYKKTGVASSQYVPKPDTDYYMPLKLGRLSWNQESHNKWTLLHATTDRRFHHMDVWTPSRGVCEKLNAPPDVYFMLSNERDAYHLSVTAFEWMAVFAVATDFLPEIKQDVIDLAQAMHAKKAVYRERGWQQNIQDEHWRLINSIQDTFPFGIYKAQEHSLHQTPFDDIRFEPFWEVLLA